MRKRLGIFALLICSSFVMVACSYSRDTVSVSSTVTDDHLIDRFMESYENLPEWLRDDMQDNGWEVRLCTGLSQKYERDINGLTTYQGKMIEIEATDYATGKHVMCHEAGHYLDCVIGDGWKSEWPSQSDEFVEIFKYEYESLYDNLVNSKHAGEDSYEYWAESCFYYMALPDKLEEYCPQTYEYLDRVITEYSGLTDVPAIAYN